MLLFLPAVDSPRRPCISLVAFGFGIWFLFFLLFFFLARPACFLPGALDHGNVARALALGGEPSDCLVHGCGREGVAVSVSFYSPRRVWSAIVLKMDMPRGTGRASLVHCTVLIFARPLVVDAAAGSRACTGGRALWFVRGSAERGGGGHEAGWLGWRRWPGKGPSSLALSGQPIQDGQQESARVIPPGVARLGARRRPVGPRRLQVGPRRLLARAGRGRKRPPGRRAPLTHWAGRAAATTGGGEGLGKPWPALALAFPFRRPSPSPPLLIGLAAAGLAKAGASRPATAAPVPGRPLAGREASAPGRGKGGV